MLSQTYNQKEYEDVQIGEKISYFILPVPNMEGSETGSMFINLDMHLMCQE